MPIQNSLLYKLLKNYTINDAIQIENQDPQFLALKKLFNSKKLKKEDFLFAIICNALVSYQLSGKWENRWQEFANFFINYNFNWNFLEAFENLLKNSKNNKRFISNKLKRIKKILSFYSTFKKNFEFYFENLVDFNTTVSQIMEQKSEAKTIVFATKMFNYWSRLILNKIIYFPFEIKIPLDSRLTNLYNISFQKKWKPTQILNFYQNLSETLKIPPLHLDSILRVNYEKILNKLKNSRW